MTKKLLLSFIAITMLVATSFAQNSVKGTVKDSKGDPVIGASVIIKGTTIGVSSDSKGAFDIGNIKDINKDILEVSFIGMASQQININGRKYIDVVLEDLVNQVDKVVVTGYGGNKIRADLTGSVGSVSGATLERVPVASAAEALVGKIAGVQVTMTDGAPGSEVNIRIRGGTSVTQDNKPLFIVDGFPVDNIDNVPPTDIQSIDVLKDASLTAIYGARGGNGVVIVTTKSAKPGKFTVTFNHTTQVRTLTRALDLMNPYEFVKAQWEYATIKGNSAMYKFRSNFGTPWDFEKYKRFGRGNDWQNEILGGTPMSYMYNLTIGGGSDNLKFISSITHNQENGILIGSGVMRTSVNTKINANLRKNLTILVNPVFNYRQDNGAGASKVGKGGIIDVLRYRPTNGLRDFVTFDPKSVDPDQDAIFEYSNPKGDIDQNYSLKNSYGLINQASIQWTVFKGFSLRSEGSVSLAFGDTNRFWGWMTSEASKNNKLPLAEIENTRSTQYTWTNTASYNFSKGVNNFSFLVGQEIRNSQKRYMTYSSRYFPRDISPSKAINNMNIGERYENSSSLSTPDRTESFFSQANYNFDHKYLLSATLRADGSTKFDPANQWGYFPAISGGWIISREDFMKNIDKISMLKARIAFGTAGNNRIDDDMWRYMYSLNNYGPGWGVSETGANYYSNAADDNTFPNTKIKWESTLTRNAALDIGLLNDRFTITPEIYWNTTSDLLYWSDIPTTTGYVKQMQNIGQVTNRGVELTINAKIIQNSDYYVNGILTFGKNKTRVDKLNGVDTELWKRSSWSSEDDYLLKVGDQLGLIYGYVYDGIYSFDDFTNAGMTFTPKPGLVNNDALFGTAPGRPKYRNFVDDPEDGGNNIVNEKDKVVIGNTNPKFSGGFGFNAGWKNFDFTANFTYMYGFDVNNATRYDLMSYKGNSDNYYNLSTDLNADKRWTYVNAEGDRIANFNQYYEANKDKTMFSPVYIEKRITSSLFIEDGSFLRFQDMTIGYTLPKATTRKMGINNLRVYFSGYNLWIWTKYTGYDPEVDVQSGLMPGLDFNRYPRSRNYVLGLNLTF